MSASFEISAELREDKGKGASRRLRRLADRVPAVVYGGQGNPVSIMLEHRHMIKALEDEAFYSHIITLNLAGKSEQVILKDLQRHPAKPRIMHADFLRVEKGHKITVNVPLHFLNEDTCPGVKLEGGVVAHLMSDVEIICLPEDLPEFIEVDLIEMNLGDSVHLSDLKIPAKTEIVALSHGDAHDHDQAVCSVNKRRAEVIEPEEEAGGEEEAPEGGEE